MYVNIYIYIHTSLYLSLSARLGPSGCFVRAAEDRRIPPTYDLRSRRSKKPPSSIFDLRFRRSKNLPICDLRPRGVGRRLNRRRRGGCDFFENREGSSKMGGGSSIFWLRRTKNSPSTIFGAERRKNPPSSNFSTRRSKNSPTFFLFRPSHHGADGDLRPNLRLRRS